MIKIWIPLLSLVLSGKTNLIIDFNTQYSKNYMKLWCQNPLKIAVSWPFEVWGKKTAYFSYPAPASFYVLLSYLVVSTYV